MQALASANQGRMLFYKAWQTIYAEAIWCVCVCVCVWGGGGGGGARFRVWQFRMHLVSNPDFSGWFRLETDM